MRLMVYSKVFPLLMLMFLSHAPSAYAVTLQQYVAQFTFDDFTDLSGVPVDLASISGTIGFTVDIDSPDNQTSVVDFINLTIDGFSFTVTLDEADFGLPGTVSYETSNIISSEVTGLPVDTGILSFGTEFLSGMQIVNGIDAVGDGPADFFLSIQTSFESDSLFTLPMGLQANFTFSDSANQYYQSSSPSFQVTAVPIPGALVLFGAPLASLLLIRKRAVVG